MRIASITLKNFQCFGPDETTIEMDKLTCFIGANGTGKTAALQALCRLFGSTHTLRKIHPSDFHVPMSEKLTDLEERDLMIEVRIEFPELELEGATPSAIPHMFNQLLTDSPEGRPYCRIRLEATWTQTQIDGGDVTERLWWVRPNDSDPSKVAQTELSSRDRQRIQVHYVPASRDTEKQLANVSGTLLHQLLASVIWTEALRNNATASLEQLRDEFSQQTAVTHINTINKKHWNELYSDQIYATPTLSFAFTQFDALLKGAQVVFGPTMDDTPHQCDRLSDGQQSLFYFAFINTIFTIQQAAYAASCIPAGEAAEDESSLSKCIACEKLSPAALTIFAVEEPENHLSPHYLARIINQLGEIADRDSAQVVLTSHSSSIVSRIEPEKLRYFRVNHKDCQASVKAITLPTDDLEAAKYIREAVRAFPELYFSRLVVLCEGDSEEIVLPRFASICDSQLDLAFVSVVPLGGRHVNHLWRLLDELKIPYVTYLDLDRERKTGGWATIKYVLNQLLKLNTSPVFRTRLLTLPESDGDNEELSEDQLDKLPELPVDDIARLDAWCIHLRSPEYSVFFSAPLDLDFLMLRAYPEAYRDAVDGRGPTGRDKNGIFDDKRIQEAAKAIFGKEGSDGSTYDLKDRQLFPYYTYLFYGRGKPTTHTVAWLGIPDSERISKMPEPISALMNCIQSKLCHTVEP